MKRFAFALVTGLLAACQTTPAASAPPRVVTTSGALIG